MFLFIICKYKIIVIFNLIIISVNKYTFSEFYLESDINSVNIYFEHESPDIEQQEIFYYIVRKRLLGESDWDESSWISSDGGGLHNYEWQGLNTNQVYEFQVLGYGGYYEAWHLVYLFYGATGSSTRKHNGRYLVRRSFQGVSIFLSSLYRYNTDCDKLL